MDIEKILDKYPESLGSISDLLADKEPSFMFNCLINAFGYLLKNDPDKVLSKNGVLLRRKLNILIRTLGKGFLKCPQVIENRNILKNPDSTEKDPGITLPDTPVIWAPNHYFKDDTLASITALKRHAYILFGSLPQFYNTFDGVTAWLNGVVMTNRKSGASKKASVPKAVKAMNYGADLLVFGEGVWNKSPNRLLLDFWPGIYRIAKETGCLVVPMAHYIEDPTNKKVNNVIHTVVDDPIKIDNLSEKAGLDYLREIIATWHYLLMERYGKSTREKELQNHKTTIDAWEQALIDRVATADMYDTEIEFIADFRPKEIILPEAVFQPIADISNISKLNAPHVAFANNMVSLRKKEDFQRRF